MYRRMQRSFFKLVAAMSFSIHRVKVCFVEGANANATNQDGYTPLHVEVSKRNPNSDIILTLLEHGAHVSAISNCGITPLHLLILLSPQKPYYGAYQSLGMEIKTSFHDSFGFFRNLPVNVDVKSDVIKTLKILLKYGADPNMKTPTSLTSLHLALMFHQPWPELLQELLNNGADVNSPDNSGYTPINYAQKSKLSPRLVKLLLESGAQLKFQESGSFYGQFETNIEYKNLDKLIILHEDIKVDFRERKFELNSSSISYLKLELTENAKYNQELTKHRTECIAERNRMRNHKLSNNLTFWNCFFQYEGENPLNNSVEAFGEVCYAVYHNMYPKYKDILENAILKLDNLIFYKLLRRQYAYCEYILSDDLMIIPLVCLLDIASRLLKKDLYNFIIAFYSAFDEDGSGN